MVFNQASLFKRALEKWGKDPQLNMVFEELGELITTLSRVIRGRDKPNALLEEIADVEIMLEQLKIIFDFSPDDLRLYKMQKLQRLEKRLNQ